MTYDVVIVGGGPAGSSAALALGRSRRRVLLCDGGPRRNAAAERVYNFVTRDGVPPLEFRRIAREQLATYPNVEVRDAAVTSITGEKGAFDLLVGDALVGARRILLCMGMIDEGVALEGFAALWGTSIFQCPYCHAWEHQDQAFGLLKPSPEHLGLALLLRAWTASVVVLTDGQPVPADVRPRLEAGGVVVDERPLARLERDGTRLTAVRFTDGTTRPLDVLFARPPQRHVPLVTQLDVALDEAGYVRIDPVHKETSRPGVYAAGDLTTPMQGAILAAAAGTQAAAMLNHDLVPELATAGRLD